MIQPEARERPGSEVRLVGLGKRYGNFVAVDSIDLTIPAASYCCLLGPSGCGKTSTLRMIAGHESISSGELYIGAECVNGLAPARRSTAMMFQSYALFPHLSCVDNVAFSLRMRGVARRDRVRRAMQMLELVHMESLAKRFPQQLSGGQQQRVALARALITDPAVLLLDEPLSALDPFLRVRMRAELRRIQSEIGITFVHVTHSQEEAMALSDSVVVMNNGRIEQTGSPRDIYNRPRSAFVARFIGGHNVLTLDNGVAATLRMDRIRLDAGAAPAGAEVTGARVTAVEYQGEWVRVGLETQAYGELTAHLHEGDFDAAPVRIGDTVQARWSAEDLYRLAQGA